MISDDFVVEKLTELKKNTYGTFEVKLYMYN